MSIIFSRDPTLHHKRLSAKFEISVERTCVNYRHKELDKRTLQTNSICNAIPTSQKLFVKSYSVLNEYLVTEPMQFGFCFNMMLDQG